MNPSGTPMALALASQAGFDSSDTMAARSVRFKRKLCYNLGVCDAQPAELKSLKCVLKKKTSSELVMAVSSPSVCQVLHCCFKFPMARPLSFERKVLRIDVLNLGCVQRLGCQLDCDDSPPPYDKHDDASRNALLGLRLWCRLKIAHLVGRLSIGLR